MRLSDRAIANMKPASKVVYHYDGGGLYLKVTPAGRKVWMLRTRYNGVNGLMTIGRFPVVPLGAARVQAQELRDLGPVLGTTVERIYHTKYITNLNQHYQRPEIITARFEKDILPALGGTALVKVRQIDVTNMLDQIVDRGSHVAANRTLADVKRFFRFCRSRGLITHNPALEITRMTVGGRERPKERCLSFEEIEQFIPILLTDRFDLSTRLVLGLLLLTGQRVSEVLGIRKSEIRGVWWTIPANRIKCVRGAAPRPQQVYLCPQARLLLKIAFAQHGNQPFDSDHRVISRAVTRSGFTPHFTPHDLRRTFSTRLADLGVPPHIKEKMLNHKLVGAWAVYDRNDYLPERQAAWRLWGVRLAAIRRQVRASALPGPQ